MPVALKSGEVLRGRYRIRERIGQGGMGNIYLADDLRLEGRRCALKEVEHDRTVPIKLLKEARQQFLHEATVLARLGSSQFTEGVGFLLDRPTRLSCHGLYPR